MERRAARICQWLAARQAALIAEYAFTSYPRYDYDQHAATLTFFSGAERPDLIADVEFVGTLSTASGTWMWSWANFSLAEPVRSRITQVRDAHTGIPHLTVPLWAADQHDGWHMTAIAAEVLDAKGAYRYRRTTDLFIWSCLICTIANKPGYGPPAAAALQAKKRSERPRQSGVIPAK